MYHNECFFTALCIFICISMHVSIKLGTIPYEKLWHDMDRDSQNLTVRRVHEVIFSQVMALTHSMIELGEREEVKYGYIDR